MTLIGGEIFAGYGDWVNNTGPIEVESVAASSPLAAWSSKLVASTEQVSVFRELTDGRVVVPHVDPLGAGVGYAERAGGIWTDRPGHISADSGEHVLDMVEFGGRLWACGSDGDSTHDYAVVWHSTDGGDTWVESLRDPVSVVESRFFFLAPIGDHLWVRNGQQGHVFAWTATGGWAAQEVDLLPESVTGAAGQAWAGGWLVPSSFWPDGPPFNLFLITSGPACEILVGRSRVCGWSVGDDGNLYVLTSDREVLRAAPDTPTAFSLVVVLDEDGSVYRSLALLPGSTSAVAGTTDSRLALIEFP